MVADRRHAKLWAFFAAVLMAVTTVRGETFSTLAFDNATVQPGGPRTGDFGKIYFNIEGSNNNNFASFGAADFSSSNLTDANGNAISGSPAALNAITITLTQANASFTHTGSLNFYLVEDTTTSIQVNDHAVIFDATDPEGLNGQLVPLHLLGSGSFTGTYTPTDTSGTVDTFTFPPDSSSQLDSATVAYGLGVLSNGGTFRVLITPGDPDVSATYTGFSNTMYNGLPVTGPMLIVDVSF